MICSPRPRLATRKLPGPVPTVNWAEDEILDLIAYLESMGDPTHPNFAK